MDQNLLNFWKNYEDVINWGYRMSGARVADGSGSFVPVNTLTRVGMVSFKVLNMWYLSKKTKILKCKKPEPTNLQ